VDFDLIELTFGVAGCCNRCRHCLSGDEPPMRDLVAFEGIAQVLEGFQALTRGEQPRAPRVRPILLVEDLAHSRYLDLLALYRTLGLKVYQYATSGWRIARDPDRPRLMQALREAGVETVQCSFFGIGADHDRYAGRRGAYDGLLMASRAAVQAGFTLYWQYFTFTDTLHQIPELLALYDEIADEAHRTIARLLPPNLCGRALDLEAVRPTRADLETLPERAKASIVGGLRSEREVREEVLSAGAGFVDPDDAVHDQRLALLHVAPDLTVHFTAQLGWPADVPLDFRLGDLRHDSPGTIFDRYVAGDAPGYRQHAYPDLAMLAERYGDPHNEKVYWFRSLRTKWLLAHLRARRA
jgi:hypothetical protein